VVRSGVKKDDADLAADADHQWIGRRRGVRSSSSSRRGAVAGLIVIGACRRAIMVG
jgi:hypothetical protein